MRSDGAVDDMAEADSGFKGEVSPKGFGGDGWSLEFRYSRTPSLCIIVFSLTGGFLIPCARLIDRLWMK